MKSTEEVTARADTGTLKRKNVQQQEKIRGHIQRIEK